MAVTTISASKFIQDFTLFIRDRLTSLITDPASASRTGDSRFVLTSYPKRETVYPIITVVDAGIGNMRRLGMQSEDVVQRMSIEIRVWGRTVVERDSIAQEILNDMRDDQFGTTSARDAGLHDFRIDSCVNVSEGGEGGIKSKVMTLSYLYIFTST